MIYFNCVTCMRTKRRIVYTSHQSFNPVRASITQIWKEYVGLVFINLFVDHRHVSFMMLIAGLKKDIPARFLITY